ncbi:MAG: hypothetical protein IPJ88_17130 [Myxococcales bacterium]|nr:MAG: hypothetical protein IPJ88_17130 [Myxococcales bacterium]
MTLKKIQCFQKWWGKSGGVDGPQWLRSELAKRARLPCSNEVLAALRKLRVAALPFWLQDIKAAGVSSG